MQLYGGEGDILVEGAKWAVDKGATVVDLNMGCPVDKVTKKDGGSKLLCDPPRTLKIIERLVDAVEKASGGRVPTTAKIRLGWDDDCLVGPVIARDMERAGIQQVTVHGRTTAMRFKGEVRHDEIARVVEAVESIPVIGNGDVTSPEKCVEMMEKTGCRGVMIGRGAFAAPWIFKQCWEYQTTGSYSADPDETEKLRIIRRYFDLMLEFRDEKYAMAHIRRRISWFSKRLGPCKPLKERVRVATTPDEIRAALDEFEAGGLRVFYEGVAVGMEHPSARWAVERSRAGEGQGASAGVG